MTGQRPLININSPIVEMTARRSGLSVPEFVELGIWALMCTLKETDGELISCDGIPLTQKYQQFNDGLRTLREGISAVGGNRKPAGSRTQVR